MKKIVGIIILLLCIQFSHAYEVKKRSATDFKKDLKTNMDLMAIADNCIDGFSEKIQGGE